MKERPVIGLTPSHTEKDTDQYFLYRSYERSIWEAGGLPVILPYTTDEAAVNQMLALVDGIMVTGGPDVDPVYFGEEPLPEMGAMDPLRDAFEVLLAKVALQADIPLLGICRGIQLLNIATGGCIYQDIKSQISGSLKHRQEAGPQYPSHWVTLQAGSRLATRLGRTDLRVNSFHHQAVMDLGKGFHATAESEDGVIEALEGSEHRFVLGLQWHPERMWGLDRVYLVPFEMLVEAAASEQG